MTFAPKVFKATVKPGKLEEAKALHGGSAFPLDWLWKVKGVSRVRSQPPGGLEVMGPDPMPHHTTIYITATSQATQTVQEKLNDFCDFETLGVK